MLLSQSRRRVCPVEHCTSPTLFNTQSTLLASIRPQLFAELPLLTVVCCHFNHSSAEFGAATNPINFRFAHREGHYHEASDNPTCHTQTYESPLLCTQLPSAKPFCDRLIPPQYIRIFHIHEVKASCKYNLLYDICIFPSSLEYWVDHVHLLVPIFDLLHCSSNIHHARLCIVRRTTASSAERLLFSQSPIA